MYTPFVIVDNPFNQKLVLNERKWLILVIFVSPVKRMNLIENGNKDTVDDITGI